MRVLFFSFPVSLVGCVAVLSAVEAAAHWTATSLFLYQHRLICPVGVLPALLCVAGHTQIRLSARSLWVYLSPAATQKKARGARNHKANKSLSSLTQKSGFAHPHLRFNGLLRATGSHIRLQHISIKWAKYFLSKCCIIIIITTLFCYIWIAVIISWSISCDEITMSIIRPNQDFHT